MSLFEETEFITYILITDLVSMELFLLKLFFVCLVSLPNLILAYKIARRPHIHSIFNTSLACFFCISGIFGPISFACIIDITHQLRHGQAGQEVWIDTCSWYLAVDHLLEESLKIITSNIMFRFFYIAHANRGLVSNGLINNKLFKICFVIITLAMSLSSFLSFRLDKARDEEYPQNTIQGRICLNLRLNWDQDNSRRTSDIYIKPQILIAAHTFISACLHTYIMRRVWVFIPSLCLNDDSHACIGGKSRKNILTFSELNISFVLIISKYFIGNIFVFTMYGFQDTISQDGVYAVWFGYFILFDILQLIIAPITILVRSRANYPIIWTEYVPKEIPFFFNLKPVVCPKPARKTRKIRSDGEIVLHMPNNTNPLPAVEV